MDEIHNRTAIYTPEPQLRHPLRLAKSMGRDLWVSRELAWRLMIRNISAMYRQTIFGYLWAFLPPVLAAATFMLLQRGGVTAVGVLRIPYGLWVLSGAFLWQVFADSVIGPIRLVTTSKAMLAKINFPREALILASAGEVIFNFLVRLVILIGALAWFHVAPSWQIVLLPLPLLTLIGFGLMIGVLCSPLALLYQDIEKVVPLMLPFWMLLSGAVVPLKAVGVLGQVVALNPVFPLLDVSRNCLTGQPGTHFAEVAFILVATVALLLFGWLLYRLAMPHAIARIGG